MTLEEVKQFLEENADNEEVQNYIAGFITPDRVEAFLETDEGKQFIQPKMDKYFSQGLETWKANNLEKIVSEELSKKNPAETPEQKEIRELKQQFENIEKEKSRESLKNKVLTTLNEEGLPSNLVDVLVTADEEVTMNNVAAFKETFTVYLQKAVEDKLKSDGTSINQGTNPSTLTFDDIKGMSQSEISNNWEAVQAALKQQ